MTTNPNQDEHSACAALEDRLRMVSAEYAGTLRLTQPNREDAEDCDACAAANGVLPGGLCPYHEGVEAGVRWLAEKVGVIAEDPERAEALVPTSPVRVSQA